MLRGKAKRYAGAYLFVLPAALLFFTFDYLPTFSAFYYSLTEYHVLIPPEWVGLDNYKALAKDGVFLKSLRNSFLYFVIIVPFLVTLPLFLAILVNQKLKGIYLFRVIFICPSLRRWSPSRSCGNICTICNDWATVVHLDNDISNLTNHYSVQLLTLMSSRILSMSVIPAPLGPPSPHVFSQKTSAS